MNRTDFQRLTELRIKEAQILLGSACPHGSYYLAGYAIECALKACIAKQTKQYDFPDKQLVGQVYKHDPGALLKAAGLEGDLNNETQQNKDFDKNWVIVLNWSEESRYDFVISEKEAADLFDTIVHPKNGVLQWLKKRW
ncbi:MAG: hypothetical protein L0Z50_24205 [Verrucomicrobiales bacterium]|nr:hypothetical protein [Verrucomicrobiales bacterium]